MPVVKSGGMTSELAAVGARRRRALNVVMHVDPRFGGICATTPDFCRALEETGTWEVATVAFREEGECSPFTPADGRLVLLPRGRMRWLRESALRKRLEEEIAAADIVHVHGLWEEHTAEACRLARRHGKPYLISAHGMLDPWAVRQKRWKKAIYAALIERRNLLRAACLRAVTPAEVNDYRLFGIDGRDVTVIPLGVRVPDRVDAREFLQRYPALTGKRLVLFLGRLHRKKGLDLLCRAWLGVRRRVPEAHLVLAGPVAEDSRQLLESLIRETAIGDTVTLPGMLSGGLKWSALAAATVFVLPSYSENFAVAISEAMAVGCPVVVTRQCNRPEVAEAGAGWVIEPDVAQLEDKLVGALSLNESERVRVGGHGVRLVGKRYSWQAIGAQTADVYSRILASSGSDCG
ncbi:MAG: glycosyltransferase [Bryobacterales bacterium]|nr:glycosyltransferase [Bryobacterales bacterium]